MDYERTSLAVHDALQANVNVINRTGRDLPMAIVDLGIPPGFELDSEALHHLVERETIERFEATGNQVILYFAGSPRARRCGSPIPLRAKYPLRVPTPRASLYEYYTPTNRAWSRPVTLTVGHQEKK